MGLFGSKNKTSDAKANAELTKRQNHEQTSGYCNYIRNNMVRICKVISDLESETRVLVEHVLQNKGIRLSLKEKGNISRVKEKLEKNLQYLYLVRDFFIALAKNASDVLLKDEELALVTKFAPFFDGVQVLDIDDDEDKDQSLLGIYKEVALMYKEVFISSKKSAKRFDFEDYLVRYEEQIEEYVFPDIYSALESFKNAINVQDEDGQTDESKATETTSKVEKDEMIECPNCGTKLVANAKFCLECGSKIEIKKSAFCSECGESLAPGAKFCSSCGNKVM